MAKQSRKNLLAVKETQKTGVQSLGPEDPPEEELATHSSSLAWKIPWTEEPGGYSPRAAKNGIHLSTHANI